MRKTLLSLGMIALLHSQVMAQFPAPYCAETFGDGVEPITLVNFAGINNSSSDAGTIEHEDFTGITGNVYQGTDYTITLEGNTVGAYENFFSVFIDWNQNGTFDPSEIYDLGSIYNSDGTDGINVTATISVPMTALTGSTRMRVSKLYDVNPAPCDVTNDYGQAEDYTIVVNALSACTGTPVAGTATAPIATCDTLSIDLVLSGYTIGTGITIQWQSSTDGMSYSNIGAATSSTYTTMQTDSTYYRAVVTCTGSGMTDTSNVVYVQMVPCVCVGNYTSGTGDGDYVGMVQLETINNTTGASSTAPYYTFYNNISADLMQGSTYTITLSAGTYDENDLAAWIDFNQDGVFDNTTEKLGEINDLLDYPASASITFAVPMTATTGATRLRVRDVFDGAPGIDPCAEAGYGETEDYVINIIPAPACVTPPVAGTINGPASDTVGQTVVYSLTGFTGNIQWYFSTDGVSFSAMAGENNDSLNYTINTFNDYYLMAVLTNPGCTNDTTAIFATDVIHNDNVCDAFPLQMGVNGPYSNIDATVEAGEPAPVDGDCELQQNWCNSDLDHTVWFTFVAPPSGRVSIQSPGFDTQLAVWAADNCGSISTAQLMAANDDDSSYTDHGGVEYSSFINGLYCLVPGQTYYLQLDAYDADEPGITEIILTDIGAPTSPSVTIEDSVFCGTITFDAGNAMPGTTYDWSNGETTQTATFNTSGTVSVTVTDEYGCSASDNAVITNNEPVADFTSVQVLNVFNFTNTSSPATGITSFSWNFGDTGTSTSENPSHTYTSNGTYTVTLIITNDCGDDTITQSVTVTGLGISELNSDQTVNVFPNPASEMLNISAGSFITGIEVYGTAGQRVISQSNVNGTQVQLSLSGLETGMYVVQVFTTQGTSCSRISVVK